MKKVILGVAVSLDGYIEGPNGEYDWCFTDLDYGLKAFMKTIDSIFYGRKSFQMAGGNVFPNKKAYVFSSTMKVKGNDYLLVQGDVKQQVDRIKLEEGKDIWLFGGAELTASLINLGCVDELWLSVHPILLGGGKLLFQNLTGRIRTRLISTKSYDTGLVSLRYEIEP
jgi:dihydrofolate reductase